MQVLRRQSSQQGKYGRLTLLEKMDLCKNLLKLIEYGEPFSLINTLFGYLISAMPIPLNDRVAFDIKQKFVTIQQLLYDRLISQQSITLVVIDALQHGRMQENERDRVETFLNVLTFNFEETITNDQFIWQKWNREQSAQEQLKKNQQALKQMLEQEKRANKMAAQETEAQGWECPVCCCQIDRNCFGILECGHIFHRECINAYLRSKIQASEVDINCPLEGCTHKLQAADIFAHVDPDLKQKYQKFSFNKFVELNHSSTAWCPTAGCTAVFSFDEQLDNYKCPACTKHYCLRCRCDYHYGMTCAEYKINNRFDKNDEDFIKFVKGARYKQCPRCMFWVSRSEGCSTMTCKCGQEFCYHCGGTTCPHGKCANRGRIPPPVRAERPAPIHEGRFVPIPEPMIGRLPAAPLRANPPRGKKR